MPASPSDISGSGSSLSRRAAVSATSAVVLTNPGVLAPDRGSDRLKSSFAALATGRYLVSWILTGTLGALSAICVELSSVLIEVSSALIEGRLSSALGAISAIFWLSAFNGNWSRSGFSSSSTLIDLGSTAAAPGNLGGPAAEGDESEYSVFTSGSSLKETLSASGRNVGDDSAATLCTSA